MRRITRGTGGCSCSLPPSRGSFLAKETACLPPPTFANVSEYGARLGDAGFWAPYVTEALARHGLPAPALVADPYYELPALHFGTFRGNRRLLNAFLKA